MNTLEIQSLNKDITNERISMPYPHLVLLEPSDAVALMVPELPTGDLPIICEFNGTCRQIGSIRKSALVISDLRKISALKYVKEPGSEVSIESTTDALEVLM